MMTAYVITMRTIIDIPGHLIDQIDALAKQEKISRAEAVRRAMAEYLEKRALHKPDAGFGIWKNRTIDPLAYEDALRKECNR